MKRNRLEAFSVRSPACVCVCGDGEKKGKEINFHSEERSFSVFSAVARVSVVLRIKAKRSSESCRVD